MPRSPRLSDRQLAISSNQIAALAVEIQKQRRADNSSAQTVNPLLTTLDGNRTGATKKGTVTTTRQNQANLPRMRFDTFVRAAWEIVQPNTPYAHGKHIEKICALLTALTDSQLHPGDPAHPRNAIINIPPRHMESFLISVFWPCWVWSFRPDSQWLFASYGESLSIRDSLRCRRLIRSSWYQSRWGHVFQLTGDQNEKRRFENDRGGHRLVTTPGGLGTGEGGDFIVVDDPHKAQDAYSRALLDSACLWWDGTMSTRGNDPKTVCKVVVMQRLANADLTGHLIDAMTDNAGEHYELLILPAEYEPHPGAIGKPWSDWRVEPGELLWPARFGKREVDAISRALGNDAPGQMQQRPAAEGGAIFDVRVWAKEKNRFTIGEEPPDYTEVIARYLFIDTAFKEKETNDYSACTLFEVLSDWRVMIRPLWLERLTLTKLVARIVETVEEWAPMRGEDMLADIVIEDKGSGTSAIQTLQDSVPGWIADRIAAFIPSGDKVYRAQQAANWCGLGCVLLPKPHRFVPLLHQMLRQLEYFPGIPHDDIIDTITMGILYLENYIAAGYQARNEESVA